MRLTVEKIEVFKNKLKKKNTQILSKEKLNTDLPEDVANEIFDSIMDYEQKVVYDNLSH